jgi:thiol-disulfide isomerase/thioredoxin
LAGTQDFDTSRPAPALTLPLLAGGSVDLSRLRGRVVLVNFWATWCPTCLMEIPSLKRLASATRGKPFGILAVDAGEAPGWVQAYSNKLRLNFPIALDSEHRAMSTWQVMVMPTSFLVDKAGRIRYVRVGPAEWDAPEMLAVINQMLREQ